MCSYAYLNYTSNRIGKKRRKNIMNVIWWRLDNFYNYDIKIKCIYGFILSFINNER